MSWIEVNAVKEKRQNRVCARNRHGTVQRAQKLTEDDLKSWILNKNQAAHDDGLYSICLQHVKFIKVEMIWQTVCISSFLRDMWL